MTARMLLAILFLPLLLGCERYRLDRQMEQLCRADGGMRIREVVTLPAEMFDKNGDPFPGWRERPTALRLSSAYTLSEHVIVIKPGDPLKGQGRLVRFRWTIIRVSDQSLLGEAVAYGRSGGDLLVLDHFTSKTCPEGVGAPGLLIRAVFQPRS